MSDPRYHRSESGQPPSSRSAAGDFAYAPSPTNSDGTGLSLSVNDIYFVLFRQKWLILITSLLGIGAAAAVWKLRPPPYVSDAQLLIRYVQEVQAITASDAESRIKPDGGSGAIMQTELTILSSFDLALAVADAIGPERIVGPGDPAEIRQAAAGFIQANLRAETPTHGNIISVEFRAAEKAAVQQILNQVIESYLKRHVQIHSASSVVDESLTQQTDVLRGRLNETEGALRKLKADLGVVSLEDAKKGLMGTIEELEREIRSLRVGIAERQAELAAIRTNNAGEGIPAVDGTEPVPEDKQTVYRQLVSQLQILYRREQELIAQFTPETPMVARVRTQISETENLKRRLEKEFPNLASQPVAFASPSASISLPEALNPMILTTQIKAAETRARILGEQVAEARKKLEGISAAEAAISELERRKELEEQQYRRFATNLESRRIDESLGPGRISNIQVLQAPSPPARDFKKIAKMLALLAAGGVAGGIGLAFALELFLDQSIRRASEVESRLNLPLFMAIPRLKSIARDAPRAGNPRLLGRTDGAPDASGNPTGPASMNDKTGLVPWTSQHALKEFFDGLRNRIVYNFEMRNITRKPKLVALTSCGPESGVSTIAAGLAASLSETGDGNVLLVDMNPDRKTTQHFHRGDLKIGLDDVLTEDRRDDALVRENLYMISQDTAEDRLSWVMPKRFASIVPKLKASDYDYIIFDLPPVSQISATPQIARFMDQVLIVAESEKTSREAIKRAGAMLAEAGANVGVILNKTKAYVPAALES